MIGYEELYETLRKERYSEQLQALPKKFIEEFHQYLSESKETPSNENSLFTNTTAKSKQLENAVSLFKELMLKRKRKILNLVFVATETGIMKKDYENMLPVENEVFDSLVRAFEKGDKEISKILQGENPKEESKNKMVIFKQDIDQFMDHEGKTIGPFKSGQLANLNHEVASILVQGEKASFVDES